MRSRTWPQRQKGTGWAGRGGGRFCGATSREGSRDDLSHKTRVLRWAHAPGRARPRCGRTPFPAPSPPPATSQLARLLPVENLCQTGAQCAGDRDSTEAAARPVCRRDAVPDTATQAAGGTRAPPEPPAPRPQTRRPSWGRAGARPCQPVSRSQQPPPSLHGTCPKSQNRSWARGGAAGSQRTQDPRVRDVPGLCRAGAAGLTPQTSLPRAGGRSAWEQGVPGRAWRPLPSSFPPSP